MMFLLGIAIGGVLPLLIRRLMIPWRRATIAAWDSRERRQMLIKQQTTGGRTW